MRTALSYNRFGGPCSLSFVQIWTADRSCAQLTASRGEVVVTDEEPILEEAMDNLKEAAQRIRATQNRVRASGLVDHPDYGELSYRLSAALAMTEAAFVEARRRSE